MLKMVDHIGIYVENLDEALKKYEKMFHIKPDYIETIEASEVQIAMIPVGEVMVELIAPLIPGKGQFAKVLAERGEGLDHIAYRIDDIDSLLADMKKANIKLVDKTPRPGAGGSRIAFISPDEANNVSIELVERKGEGH